MALTAGQRMGAQRALRAIAEFYADPDNEKRFQEWSKSRRGREPEKPAPRRIKSAA